MVQGIVYIVNICIFACSCNWLLHISNCLSVHYGFYGSSWYYIYYIVFDLRID